MSKIRKRGPNRSRVSGQQHFHRDRPLVLVVVCVNGSETGDTSVVDQIIDPPETFSDLVGDLLYAVGVCYIHCPPSSGTPGIADLSDHGVHLGLPKIGDCDMGPFVSEKMRGCSPLSAAGTGNQHHPVLYRSAQFS
ncbi:uncharacterized protein METZ01_LOCUS104628 [marine metagenome]|uniref:Uncharacterized protein n=1 Tax=marine metagenome TaxID=408172 RepID=A0A381WH10_9ZZZZ